MLFGSNADSRNHKLRSPWLCDSDRGTKGESTTRVKGYSGRCDDFVEQRKHRSMAPHVVYIDEGGAPIQRSHSLDCKIVSLTAIIGDLVSRHNQCA